MSNQRFVISQKRISRRTALKMVAAAPIASPWTWVRSAEAATGEVLVRSPGGSYEETQRKNFWIPFEKETGIRVVPVTGTPSKLFAMFKSGNVELDVIDIGSGPLIALERQGALAPIAYENWKTTDPADIDPAYRQKYRVANCLFATVMGFNTKAVPSDRQPQNWEQFWDVKKFPGPRSLQDISGGYPSLEAALLADGVPKDKVYPMDLDRAFASMSRLRPNIPKFWDTGALSVQMLIDQEVYMTTIWTSRVAPAAAAGQPVAWGWEGHLTQVNCFAVFKGAKNMENAQRFVEFGLRPEIQAAVGPGIVSGMVNKKAYALVPADYSAKVPGSPQQEGTGILMDDVWWEDNRELINKRWARWIQT